MLSCSCVNVYFELRSVALHVLCHRGDEVSYHVDFEMFLNYVKGCLNLRNTYIVVPIDTCGVGLGQLTFSPGSESTLE